MKRGKLPVQQLSILTLCRLAEPISVTSVLPYLPEMIQSFGVHENDVAVWAGAAASLYSASQCISAIPWGILGDNIGRRTVILMSFTITTIGSLMWGFSTSLPMALTARVIAGSGNGVLGIMRTMVAEMCPWKELQPIAFSIMPFAYNMGAVVGPAFGGALSNPYHRVPGAPASSNRLFERFPYALPNVLAASVFLFGIIVATLFLRETLPGRKDHKDIGLRIGEKIASVVHNNTCGIKRQQSGSSDAERGPLLDVTADVKFGSISSASTEADEVEDELEEKSPSWTDVLSTQSCLNVAVYSLICMHSTSHDQLLPVYMHYPVQTLNSPDVHLPLKFNGGFGLQANQMGLLFTLFGIVSMIFQIFFFPPIANRFGLLPCLKATSIIFPIAYFLSPFASLFPTSLSRQAFLFTFWLVKGLCFSVAYPISTILLSNSVSSSTHLARLNGLATTTSSIGRAVGPLIMGPMFMVGVDRGYIVVPFWTLAFITALSAIPVFFIVDPDEMKDKMDFDG